MLKAIATFSLVILVCACCGAAGYWRGVTVTRQAHIASSTYVFGRTVDAQGGLVPGVRVELGTQSSMTNASGQWGMTYLLAAGQTYNLYVFPEVARLTPPSGVQATLQSGNVIRFVVPSPVPAQLGAFVLTMKPTLTPIPSEPVITQTWTPTRTQTKTPTRTSTATPFSTLGPFVTVTARPSPTGWPILKPGFYDAPTWVQEIVRLDMAAELGVVITDSFTVFADTYLIGIPCSELMWHTICKDGDCVTVEYQCYGSGNVMLIRQADDPWLVGIVYGIFAEGNANWHSKETATP